MKLEQVQDFTPTPMTLCICKRIIQDMIHILWKKYMCSFNKGKKIQQLFFFLYDKDKRKVLKTELIKINRIDIIKRLGL